MPTALSFCPPPLSVSLFLSLRPSSSPCLLCVCVCVCVKVLCVCFFNNYLFLPVLGLCCCVSFSQVVGSRSYSPVVGHGLLIAVASLVGDHGLQSMPVSAAAAAGSRAQTRKSWRTGLVALQHVGSSCTRDDTHVSCISRWILHHLATWEALLFLSFICLFSVYGI